MTTTTKTMTADDLRIRLSNTFNPFIPILVDTGDGIFKIDSIEEGPHEIVITLGEMP